MDKRRQQTNSVIPCSVLSLRDVGAAIASNVDGITSGASRHPVGIGVQTSAAPRPLTIEEESRASALTGRNPPQTSMVHNHQLYTVLYLQ